MNAYLVAKRDPRGVPDLRAGAPLGPLALGADRCGEYFVKLRGCPFTVRPPRPAL
jgi:hypothetical protein